MDYINKYLEQTAQIAGEIDKNQIEKAVKLLKEVREKNGRLFILGVGGSAGNASHAVNDFRKIAGIESYAPTDNVSELTARTNDDGWSSVFSNWLKISKLNSNDLILVFSVGGGNVGSGTAVIHGSNEESHHSNKGNQQQKQIQNHFYIFLLK